MKKIFLIIFLAGLIFPVISLAGEYKTIDGRTVKYEGLVPCGKQEAGPNESLEVTAPCEFCHLFIASNNLIQFFMLRIVPLAAVLMLVIGGVLFLFGGAKPDMLKQAQGIVTAVIVGVIIILAAWVAVNTLFDKSGIIKTGGWKWYEIQCSVEIKP